MLAVRFLVIVAFVKTGFTLEVIPAGGFSENFAHAQAHYDGNDHVYVVGGNKVSVDVPISLSSSIWRYNVITGDKVKVGQFPTGIGYGSIGSSPKIPDKFFYIGGKTDTADSSPDIYSIDLVTLQSEKVGVLPHGVNSAAAVSDGHGSIYTFGGDHPFTQSILQYNMENNVVTSHGVLPENITDAMAGWVDGSGYILGGAYYSQRIYKFTPNTNGDAKLELLPIELPNPQHSSGSVTVGRYIYMVGGIGLGRVFRLTRFDTQTHEIHVENYKMPRAFTYASAVVYVEKLKRIYLFGGYEVQNWITVPTPFINYIQL